MTLASSYFSPKTFFHFLKSSLRTGLTHRRCLPEEPPIRLMRLCVHSLCASLSRARVSRFSSNVTRSQISLKSWSYSSSQRVLLRSLSTDVSPVSRYIEPEVDRQNDREASHRHGVDFKSPAPSTGPILSPIHNVLPVTCPGCGALSQEANQHEAGFYTRSRKAVKAYLRAQPSTKENGNSTDEADDGIQAAGAGTIAGGIAAERDSASHASPLATPVCDRCHDLIYNSKGQSIAHPTVEALADSIAESPFRRNHVYHVLDAADFPMSVFPKFFQSLELAKPRSRNRRSQHKISTKPSVSFIITRSDLLGPTKEMVDKLMPYFQKILRGALGRVGTKMRMGNVHLVSAKRGWWTKDIKDSIWDRGGGNWLVGRANVGKSNLFEVLFPKGSGDRAPVYAEIKQQNEEHESIQSHETFTRPKFLPEDSLLPPPQPEVPFPALPTVSSLPGTTASPIRLPFGNNKGELIDLPGLERGDLERYIHPEHKLDLVMQYRPNVEQHVIKPGQSLLLGGGLIRITPQLDPADQSTTMLAYPFVPIKAHVTSTEKAIGAQSQQRDSGIQSILAEGVGEQMSTAGLLNLTTDVTRARAGALLRAGVPVNRLQFRVYSTDILIEGVGWVELVCQVRRQRRSVIDHLQSNIPVKEPLLPSSSSHDIPSSEPHFKPFVTQPASESSTEPIVPDLDSDSGFAFPKVEIFSPRGKHISQREPLGAWLLWDNGRQRKARMAAAQRPRKPMAGAKKQAKKEAREKKDKFPST